MDASSKRLTYFFICVSAVYKKGMNEKRVGDKKEVEKK